MQIKRLVISAAVILAAAFFWSAALEPGAQVADFSLKDYTGKSHSLSENGEKVATVLIFVSTRCPVSNAYNKRMQELFEDYSPRNIAVLGINSNREESPQDIQEHAKQNGLTFPIVKDENNVVADQMGAEFTPEVFVISPKLTVLYHGRIDDSQRPANIKRQDLRSALEEILAGKPISDASTRAFGCSIKRVM